MTITTTTITTTTMPIGTKIAIQRPELFVWRGGGVEGSIQRGNPDVLLVQRGFPDVLLVPGFWQPIKLVIGMALQSPFVPCQSTATYCEVELDVNQNETDVRTEE